MRGELAFEALTAMRDDLIFETAEKLSLAAPAFTRRREKRAGPLFRFLNSGWGVAMICAIVSLSVLAAIIWAGNRPPAVKPPIGTNEPETGNSSPHVHEFGDWITTKEATCTQTGIRERTCLCGVTEEEILETTPHQETAMPDVAPTVTQNGSRGGTMCAVCEAVLTDPHTILPYIGHTDLAYELLPDGQNCAITGRGSCTASELYIPSEIDGYTVTQIAAEAFMSDQTLTKLQLPHTMNTIDTDAFIRCSSLAEVNFPDSLMYIGPFAFGGCESLTRVELPDEMLILNTGAFAHCSSLSEIVFPEKLQIIYPFALSNCISLTEVYLPASLKQIDIDAFSQCQSLADIYFAGTKAQWKAIGYNPEESVGAKPEGGITVHFKVKPE